MLVADRSQTSVILFAEIFSSIGILATSSRMLWAFARERGLPGSTYIAKVERLYDTSDKPMTNCSRSNLVLVYLYGQSE